MSDYVMRRFGLLHYMKVLDIGCGTGKNLKRFPKESLGIDILPVLLAEAGSKGHRIKLLDAETELLAVGETFDLLWCSDFLVHLKNPYRFLLNCRELMNEQSLLMVQIPQYTSLIPQSIKKTYVSPTHFYAFHDPTLSYLLESAGFTIIKKSGCIRALPDWLNALLEPFTQRLGSNIWILAKKNEDFVEKKGWKLPQDKYNCQPEKKACRNYDGERSFCSGLDCKSCNHFERWSNGKKSD